MLETKNLVKIYKPKKGVPVRALNDVSIRFPDTGMVFLLGKSGSGKSTLLNVLGGLDKYEGGEILIKGVSSKKFKQKDFDSYRNTYVGFIFQEYNILEEFTVGANIALALELQGKKATDAELNRILEQVDLVGFGHRRPNELSGGQKQRVAIARALVKSPKIIMADEPSGALDSETGKQVFETLKKLSKEKLVIIVSHDRDFAMEYADRIIELADGQVISDISYISQNPDYVEEQETAEVEKSIVFEDNFAKIPMGYHLTEEDRIAINEYIDKLNSEMVLQFGDDAQAQKEKVYRNKFAPTTEESIKNEDKSPFALIKSKLSLKNSFKIGSGGLKYKKFRLVMTIILSTIAFTLFGLVDTFSAYNHIDTTANSIYDTKVKYASITQDMEIDSMISVPALFSEEAIKDISKETGIDFKGVVTDDGTDRGFGFNVPDFEFDMYGFYATSFNGVAEIDEDTLEPFGYELTDGRMPDGEKNEIAISKYVAETFIEHGYTKPVFDGWTYVKGEDVITIKKASDLLNKTLLIAEKEYTIVGIVDTKLDMTRYEDLINTEDESLSQAIINLVLYSEFSCHIEYDYTGMMMVGEGFIERSKKENGCFVYDMNSWTDLEGGNYYFGSDRYARFSEIDKDSIIWIDGAKTKLGEKEIIVTLDIAMGYFAHYDENGELYIDDSVASQDFKYLNFNSKNYDDDGYRIVGVLDNSSQWENSTSYGGLIFSDELFNREYSYLEGEFNFIIGAMPEDKDDIHALAEFCYGDEDSGYALNNPASSELDILDTILDVVSGIFLFVGIFFALFASILLSNFIATSISYKKQEIGILRAIGARSNDVFRIFFAEAFIIASVNFVLAFTGTGVITFIINTVLRNIGLLVTVLNFGIRQFLVLALISVAVAFIASFLPVKKIASKRPIDAIRDR